MRCCGVHAKLAEQLDGSTFSFLCADLCRQPCLYLFGLLVAAVQSLLLLLVWARAEANMFCSRAVVEPLLLLRRCAAAAPAVVRDRTLLTDGVACRG